MLVCVLLTGTEMKKKVLAYELLLKKLQKKKLGKIQALTPGCTSCATVLFSPRFDVICNLLLNRRAGTCHLLDKFFKTVIGKLNAIYNLLGKARNTH